MSISAEKMADWSYAVLGDHKENFRGKLEQALLQTMREGDKEKLAAVLNALTDRMVLRNGNAGQKWLERNAVGREYWDLCYGLAQRVLIAPEEVKQEDKKVVSLRNPAQVPGDPHTLLGTPQGSLYRNLVAVPIAFPIRAGIDGTLDLELNELSVRLQQEFGVFVHWYPGIVDDYPVSELHVVDWLHVHDELFYGRMSEERMEELRFDQERRAERFNYQPGDMMWDWDFVVLLGCVEGDWSYGASRLVINHLGDVLNRVRGEDEPFEVGRIDLLRKAQYQGGWIAKCMAVNDFLSRTKGPYRVEWMDSALMTGWVLANGIKDWLMVLPNMHDRTKADCLLMLWEALERNQVKAVGVGPGTPKPPELPPSFMRY